MNDLYEVKLCKLSSQFSDGYKNAFFFFVFLSLIFVIAASRSNLLSVVCMGAFCGAIPSLWLGLTCKMRFNEKKDASRIARYLSNAFHVERGGEWVPKLPTYLYFRTQAVRVEGSLVVGPRVTILKLKKVLSAI